MNTDAPEPVPSTSTMPFQSTVPFQYTVLRAVPRVDRGEYVNIGVVLYCHHTAHAASRLAIAVHLDDARLGALDPQLDLDVVHAALDGIRAVCEGSAQPGWTTGERFGWLTAPRSTVVQPGPVHSGVTGDPQLTLDRLMTRLVR